MKLIAHISRILVGIEFIFSGFVKVVDPYGTGLKLEEYFEVFATDLPSLSGFFNVFASNSLALSLMFCSLELVLGVALLFNFRMKITAWLVILLMGFFTFLTFYSAYFNRVTDCGCFGDFLKLKPWHSFYKDVISMVFITIIFIYRNKFGMSKWGAPMVLISSILALGVGIYGIVYLPIIDFLPYAAGKNIPQQMVRPDIKPDINYIFLDKANKKEIESKEYLTDTLKFKYLSSEVLNEDLLKPKITDYSLADTSGNDFTQQSFEGAKLFITLKYKKGLDKVDFEKINNIASKVAKSEISPVIIHSLSSDQVTDIINTYKLKYPFYSCDEKVLKTMARNNPCLVLLKNGTVLKKWSSNNLPDDKEIIELVNKN